MGYIQERKALYNNIYSKVKAELETYCNELFANGLSAEEFVNSGKVYDYIFRDCIVNVFKEIIDGKRVDAKISNEGLKALLSQWNILNYICEDRYFSCDLNSVYEIVVAQAAAAMKY